MWAHLSYMHLYLNKSSCTVDKRSETHGKITLIAYSMICLCFFKFQNMIRILRCFIKWKKANHIDRALKKPQSIIDHLTCWRKESVLITTPYVLDSTSMDVHFNNWSSFVKSSIITQMQAAIEVPIDSCRLSAKGVFLYKCYLIGHKVI